ncbi:MAG: hypothetical protein H0U82_01115, partial [Actinobacteria bacterium]|nr:hypothetical protein [Actinomycetota bacterium]
MGRSRSRRSRGRRWDSARVNCVGFSSADERKGGYGANTEHEDRRPQHHHTARPARRAGWSSSALSFSLGPLLGRSISFCCGRQAFSLGSLVRDAPALGLHYALALGLGCDALPLGLLLRSALPLGLLLRCERRLGFGALPLSLFLRRA